MSVATMISRLATASFVLLAVLASVPIERAAAAIPPCSALAGTLTGQPAVKSATSSLVAASGTNAAYCLVSLTYGTSVEQNINILVAMPLSAADGGSGGVQGAWNGRTQGLGGGGCAGISSVNSAMRSAVNAGYVGSGTDLGHAGGDCEPGVNLDGTYNEGFIQDFIRVAIKQQVLFSKDIASVYYGMPPAYDYWNGCSTGGRQGYLLAQELGDELDGVLANAPAIYWTRFQTAQMWGQIAMKDLTGGPIDSAKLSQAAASAVAACDADDGVTDGLIDDPRTCTFSARSNICGSPTAPAANCLTPAEADAVDKIWDGPRNRKGNKIWFGLDRGSPFNILNGSSPFALGVTQFHWDEHDRNFDWQDVSLREYPEVAEDGSRNIADVTDTFDDLDEFKAHGGKLLTFVGTNDQFIYPRGVIKYYREMALRYASRGHGRNEHGRNGHGSHGHNGRPDFAKLQKFYRLFRAPGVGHCGGGTGPSPVDPFAALVNWVEHNVPPQTLLASGGSAAPPSGRTRPLCPYPQTAVYNGSGDINDAGSFHCGGNVERTDVVCRDTLVRYKHEEHGELDFRDSGVRPSDCRRYLSHRDHDDHHGGHRGDDGHHGHGHDHAWNR